MNRWTDTCPYCGNVKRTPANAGKPWTPELDQRLCQAAENLRDAGCGADVAIGRLAYRFQRTCLAIECRLQKLGLVEENLHG